MESIVLREFASEVEARVVESYLRSEGFDVTILDTHSPATHRYQNGKRGFRLVVRADEAEKITQLLEERTKTAHLSVVDENHEPAPKTTRARALARIKNFFGMS